MLEVKPYINTFGTETFCLVDGAEVVLNSSEFSHPPSYFVFMADSLSTIGRYSFGDLPSEVADITFAVSTLSSAVKKEMPDLLHSASVSRQIDKVSFGNSSTIQAGDFCIELLMQMASSEWDHPFSTRRYYDEFFSLVLPTLGVSLDEVEDAYHKLTFEFDPQSLIGDSVRGVALLIANADQESRRRVVEEMSGESLVKYFKFPTDLSTFCEQYLLYFVQFLRDLGVHADAEVKRRADEVLFKVTPSDSYVALDQIRQALDIYLEMAISPVSYMPSSGVGSDLAIDRAVFQVANLQNNANLMVAERRAIEMERRAFESALQLDRATIVKQQDHIEMLQVALRSGVSQHPLAIAGTEMGSPPPSEKKPDDKEHVAGGLVTLGSAEIKGTGVQVNVAEAFRRARALFQHRGKRGAPADSGADEAQGP